MIRTVTLYSDPDSAECKSVEKFLSELEVKLIVHNVKERPLNYAQISELLRHFKIDHFYNSNGKSNGSGSKRSEAVVLDRKEVMQIMAADNKAIRLPIIVSGRLMTVGDNIESLKIMLQIKSNGSDPNN